MTSLRRFASVGCSVVLAALLAGGVRASAETEPEPVQVTLAGPTIDRLVVVEEMPESEQLERFGEVLEPGQVFRRSISFEKPGKDISLPPGKYRTSSVVLRGGYMARSTSAMRFEVTPEGPNTLDIGTPLHASVTVTRYGGLLELDYNVADAAGEPCVLATLSGQVPSMPSFEVFLGDQQIGSGTFEHG